MTITATAPAVTAPRSHATGRHAARTIAPAAATPATAVTTATPAQPALDASTLLRWGFEVDNDGIGAHEDLSKAMVDAATRRGLKPVLIEILADRREPSVARQRAFGRLALALAR